MQSAGYLQGVHHFAVVHVRGSSFGIEPQGYRVDRIRVESCTRYIRLPLALRVVSINID